MAVKNGCGMVICGVNSFGRVSSLQEESDRFKSYILHCVCGPVVKTSDCESENMGSIPIWHIYWPLGLKVMTQDFQSWNAGFKSHRGHFTTIVVKYKLNKWMK